jgi:tRNA pseudouridine13 synthase
LPIACDDLPPIVAVWKSTPEDFEVEELPEYLPSGVGTHQFVWIEKRGLSTQEAIERFARSLGVPVGDIGAAGLKDRQALTRQWLSIPNVAADAIRAVEAPPELRVLEVLPHGNKLRTGHLRGNRFVLTLRAVADAERDRRRVEAHLRRLTEVGLPNLYGEQRFGRRQDNARRGRELVLGRQRDDEAAPSGARRRPLDRGERRFLVSAYQSELFNRYLALRAASCRAGDGHRWLTYLPGDILQKRDSGGLFVSTEPEVDRPRVERGEVVPTGPIFGVRGMRPPWGSPARALEAAVLAEEGILDPPDGPAPDCAAAEDAPGPQDPGDAGRASVAKAFSRVAAIAQGGRRPLAIFPGSPSVETVEEHALRLRVVLPPGSYATMLLRELTTRTAQEDSA